MRCPRGKASPETRGKQEICIASNMMLELLWFKWLCRDAGVRWRWSGRRALLASPQRRRWRVSGAASPHSLRQSHRCHKKLLQPCLPVPRQDALCNRRVHVAGWVPDIENGQTEISKHSPTLGYSRLP